MPTPGNSTLHAMRCFSSSARGPIPDNISSCGVLNAPPDRIAYNQLRRTPLPLRLHYLMTPTTASDLAGGPETEQLVLGKVLQVFHDHPLMHGTDLQGELSGTNSELAVRLEAMTLDEIARVWDALDGSYQLSVSYEVSAVYIASAREPEGVTPVEVALPEYGVIVWE